MTSPSPRYDASASPGAADVMHASQDQAAGDQPPTATQAPVDDGTSGRSPRWVGDMDLPGMDDDGMPD